MKKYVIVFLCMLVSWRAQSQGDKLHETIRIEANEIILRLEITQEKQSLDSLLVNFGLMNYGIDSLCNFGLPNTMLIDGWKIRMFGKRVLEVYKPLDHLAEGKGLKGDEMLDPIIRSGHYNYFFFPKATYGINNYKRKTVSEDKNNRTYFFLPNNFYARRVFLSGSFNAWSTLKTPMTKTDSGWVASVNLLPGKHLYKFIVDGNWMHDPNNNQKEDDGQGGYNTVYFKYNHRFELEGYSEAKKVIVTGSFNQWNERELSMQKTDKGWALPVYLQEGTHAYKFIVDKTWINDKNTQILRSDEQGNFNSYISIGDSHLFELEGFRNARTVIVCGTFNNWNTQELVMNKTEKGWGLPFVLAPGNYAYKFIVDGKWMIDPANPHTENSGDYQNSILSVKPNTRFSLKGYNHSRTVRISGTFNNWNTEAYTLKKLNGEWVIDLYLEPNKYAYKFIVDGEWITDPANPLYEQNEFGGDNSVIWVN